MRASSPNFRTAGWERGSLGRRTGTALWLPLGLIVGLLLIGAVSTGAPSASAPTQKLAPAPWMARPMLVTPGGPTIVTVGISGLPQGTDWSFTVVGNGLNATYYQDNNSTMLHLSNGEYGLTFGDVPGYGHGAYPSNLTVDGVAFNVTVPFQLLPGFYLVTFASVQGLPYGWPWGAELTSSPPGGDHANGYSTLPTLPLAVGNGTYDFRTWDPNGSAPYYAISPTNGSVTVNGANVNVDVNFTYETTYYVTFVERGLASGATFTAKIVSLNVTNYVVSDGPTENASAGFLLANGTYEYVLASTEAGVLPYPQNGTVRVNGSNLPIIWVQFNTTTYPVTFSPTGIPSGTSWWVDLGGETRSSISGGEIVIPETNGSYGFTVGYVDGYAASPSYGTVSVQGAAVNVPITFESSGRGPTLYPVDFTESGLPTGTGWSVDLSGSTNSSSTSMIGFFVANGSLAFSVSSGANYSASPSSGYANVSGGGLQISINFTTTPSLVPIDFTSRDLPSTTLWDVVLTATSSGLTIEMSSTKSATGPSTISFDVSPGTFHYEAKAAGYQESNGTVVAAVGSGPQAVAVSFVAASTPASPSSRSSILAGAYSGVGIAVEVIVAAGVVLMVYQRRTTDRQRSRILVDEMYRSRWARDSSGQLVVEDDPPRRD